MVTLWEVVVEPLVHGPAAKAFVLSPPLICPSQSPRPECGAVSRLSDPTLPRISKNLQVYSILSLPQFKIFVLLHLFKYQLVAEILNLVFDKRCHQVKNTNDEGCICESTHSIWYMINMQTM